MKTALRYPIDLLIFWYHDVTLGVIDASLRFNSYILNLLSAPLLLKTLFKPLKNEYRKGLIAFSIVAGVLVKSFLLLITAMIMGVVLLGELITIAVFFLFPFILLYLIYARGPIS